MSQRRLGALAALVLIAGCANMNTDGASRTEAKTSAPTGPVVFLDREVHFPTTTGDLKPIPPGEYLISQVGSDGLKLVGTKASAASSDESEVDVMPHGEGTHLIGAVTLDHKEKLDAPAPLSFQTGEDAYQLALLLPGGQALAALGSYSGSRARGLSALVMLPASITGTQGASSITISPAAFKPRGWTSSSFRTYGGTTYFDGDTGTSTMYAPVALPAGSIVRNVQLRAYDNNSTADIVAYLMRSWQTQESVATPWGVAYHDVRKAQYAARVASQGKPGGSKWSAQTRAGSAGHVIVEGNAYYLYAIIPHKSAEIWAFTITYDPPS